ncbi:Cytochrome P460 [Nitrosomonas marina]|uniref:Cytochrome P460 n=1 Tax=Nitrosomonas marina TaxID=917 RepID=A0A1H9YIZ6_9PROT|nr:cytochrome P460 family protein [Nitrosomonas marina]SES68962.1 Cytochrome P460 [Nitrosomonas marina]
MYQFRFNLKFLFPAVVLSMVFVYAITPVTAKDATPAVKNYAVFNENGKLQRPTGYREWIYIGSPLTPNDMNDGKAAFPEFHNVYIDPISWTHWKVSGKFPDDTIIVKELVNVGSKEAVSGNGYFQGEFIGLEAMVKNKQLFPEAPGHWGFFRFTIEGSRQLHKRASAQDHENCASCHQSHAATDLVFTQYYPVLRAGKAAGDTGTGGM